MKRGPYFFLQWRRHKRGTALHPYVWCQWEVAAGTQGLARSASKHGLLDAVRLVKREAEAQIGRRIRESARAIAARLEAGHA